MSDELTLAELAETAELPARTIRYYIARGLVDGPVKAGRGAIYTRAHVARLEKIRKLQQEGRSLTEIGNRLTGTAPAAQPTPWWQHALADDVVLLVRADVAPWRMKQIRSAIDELAARLQNRGNDKEDT